MPKLYVRAGNSDFQSRDEGADYDSLAQAITVGLESAVSLATDDIHDGKTSSAIEFAVEDEQGGQLARSIVTISVHALEPEQPKVREH